jgi:hypothetical protein
MTLDYDFQEDRTTYIREQLLETTDGTEAAKDISSGFAAYFRVYEVTGTLLLNVTLTKIAITGGDYVDAGDEKSGVEGYIKPVAAYGRVITRLILADTGTDDALTVSGKREFCWAERERDVRPSPQPA